MGDFTTAGEVESVTAHEVINSSDTRFPGKKWLVSWVFSFDQFLNPILEQNGEKINGTVYNLRVDYPPGGGFMMGVKK